VSRRRDRGSGREAARDVGSGAEGGGQRGVPGAWTPGAPAPNRRPPTIPFIAQAGILVAVFAATTLIAELAGAANLGVSLGIASIAFSIALVLVIVRT
jgi:hypothetical protein